MAELTVLIIDDHPVVISGCRSILSLDGGIKAYDASSYKTGVAAFDAHKPDVTIIDIDLPDLSGFEVLRQIRKRACDAAVIMLSMNEEPTFVFRSVELGARGFLSKCDDPELLLKAVRIVARGGTYITPELAKMVAFSNSSARSNPAVQLGHREIEILRLFARGKRIGDVATTLGVSYKTVANTSTLLRKKLGAQSNAELIRIAMEMGLS